MEVALMSTSSQCRVRFSHRICGRKVGAWRPRVYSWPISSGYNWRLPPQQPSGGSTILFSYVLMWLIQRFSSLGFLRYIVLPPTPSSDWNFIANELENSFDL